MKPCLYCICIVFGVAVSVSEGCNPVSRMDVQNQALRRDLFKAEQRSVDGRIILNMDQPAMPLAGNSPTCNGPAQPLRLIGAQLGQTAVFSCPVASCPGQNSTCPGSDELQWRHDKNSLWNVRCKGYPSPFVYSQSRTSTTDYFLIHNVTVDTFGAVYCFCLRKNETRGLCVNQAYMFRPILMPADVFETPVLNITSPAGKNVTLFSKLRIQMTEHTWHRYIVRYNRRIIWAQASHPLHALTEKIFPHAGDLALNEANFSLTFPSLPKSFSGQFEVWVRPYMEMDEFVVQIINLNLT